MSSTLNDFDEQKYINMDDAGNPLNMRYPMKKKKSESVQYPCTSRASNFANKPKDYMNIESSRIILITFGVSNKDPYAYKHGMLNWRIHATHVVITIIIIIFGCILLIYEHLLNGKHYGTEPIYV